MHRHGKRLLSILALWRCKLAVVLWRSGSSAKSALWLRRSLMLHGSCLCPQQSRLNWSYGLNREHRPGIDRTRNAVLPSLQHAFHITSCVAVDQGVGVHKSAEEAATQIHSIRCSNVLHNAIQHEQRRQFPIRRCLFRIGVSMIATPECHVISRLCHTTYRLDVVF